jgi:uncharacterized protein YjbI with pentapeptide repeats
VIALCDINLGSMCCLTLGPHYSLPFVRGDADRINCKPTYGVRGGDCDTSTMKIFHRFRRNRLPIPRRWSPARKTRLAATTPRDEAVDLIKTANEDFSQSRTELFFFLATIVFVVITTLSITDRDLLFGSRVQLPILGLTMSFESFALGSPILLVATHYALLLKFGGIRAKCRAINSRLENLRLADPKDAASLPLTTTSNFMAQWLITGAADGFQQSMSYLIYFLVVCSAALIALAILMIRTLPLHRPEITGLQIISLSVDASLLALFHWRGRRGKTVVIFSGVATWAITSVVFSIPDSAFDRLGRMIWAAGAPFGHADAQRTAFAPTAFLLENGLDSASGRPVLLVSRNLIVTDDRGENSNPVPSASTQQGGVPSPKTKTSFRGRDLRYAVLDRSDLRSVDFTLADLTGASLQGTDLRNAIFGCALTNTNVIAQLRNYIFPGESSTGQWIDAPSECTSMRGINLAGADMRGVTFASSNEARVSMSGAQMNGVKLDGVDLSWLNFSLSLMYGASLVGADLHAADFSGADLTMANLTGSNLSEAELRLTALSFARLDGANLYKARAIVSDLTGASLVGADLVGGIFYGARFNKTSLWGAIPPNSDGLAWADITKRI